MNCEFKLPPDFDRQVLEAILQRLNPPLSSAGYVPDRAVLTQALHVALWTSLLRDEGRAATFTINLRPGTIPSRLIALEKSLPFTARQLAKISTATTPDVSAVHVGPGAEGLEIFGIDSLLGNVSAVRIEVFAPGTVAVKVNDVTVAFVSGETAELIDFDVYAKYFFAVESSPLERTPIDERARRFFDLARAMYRHGHGGTLLVLGAQAPASPLANLGDSLEPHYLLRDAFHGLTEVEAEVVAISRAIQVAGSATEARDLFAQLQDAEILHLQYISGLARTTAVDGATLVSRDGSLLAFGCKVVLTNTPRIQRRRPTAKVGSAVDLSDFGGTRHQSAARFVGRHAGSRAIVTSQDGKVSVLNHAGVDDVDCLEHAEWIF
ncbi:MAG TPA: hypothetical protein VL137_17230 [Polyangiaceae bacterium]|nr:hypothetical protein [Polyangiaceae bacterium]